MVGQPVIASQFDSGFNPELRFTAFAVNMDMHSGFLEREEEKPETALPEYGRTHGRTLHGLGNNCLNTNR